MDQNRAHPKTPASRFKVFLVEYERGWGSKVDEVCYFDTLDVAEAFAKDFNSQNTSDTVPDWYMTATDPQILTNSERI